MHKCMYSVQIRQDLLDIFPLAFVVPASLEELMFCVEQGKDMEYRMEYGYHQWALPANLAVLRMTAGFATWMGACVTAMCMLSCRRT